MYVKFCHSNHITHTHTHAMRSGKKKKENVFCEVTVTSGF